MQPQSTFKLRLDPICRAPLVPGNAEDIWLAADLAIFNVALPFPCRLIDGSFIPLSATRTNKTGFHGHTEFLPLLVPV